MSSPHQQNLMFSGHATKMRSHKLNLLLFSLFSPILAHGDHSHEQIPVAADADWATRHMAGSRLSQSPITAVENSQTLQKNTTLTPSTPIPSSNSTTSTPPACGHPTTSSACTACTIDPTRMFLTIRRTKRSRRFSPSSTRTTVTQSPTPSSRLQMQRV